ncbi:MAG TPA: SCP2 sterol-binding domain-containing protein [Solirubrobacteraceae bacterium]|jgi:hypothetical protein|nr:SCP2 sterol-binding domain-containing protein [Solirubrobacteraceae bacterium]
MSTETTERADAALQAVAERLTHGPPLTVLIRWTLLDPRGRGEVWELLLAGERCTVRRLEGDAPPDLRVETTPLVLEQLVTAQGAALAHAAGRLRLAGDAKLARTIVERLGGRSAAPAPAATQPEPGGLLVSTVRLVVGITRLGAEALLTTLTMFLASVGLWLGVPIMAVWCGAQVQSDTKSIGATIAAGGAAGVVGVVLLGMLLHRLDMHQRSIRGERGMVEDRRVLDFVMTVSAFVSLALFGAWFLLRSGAELAPVGIGH